MAISKIDTRTARLYITLLGLLLFVSHYIAFLTSGSGYGGFVYRICVEILLKFRLKELIEEDLLSNCDIDTFVSVWV